MKNKYNGVSTVLLLMFGLAFFLPMVWLLLSSIDSNAVTYMHMPKNPTLGNFTKVLTNPSSLQSFKMSLVLSFGQATIVTFLTVLASYALSRTKIRYKRFLMLSILFLTGLPMISMIIPIYITYFNLGVIDSVPAIIIFMSATSLPYSIWVMKATMDSVPLVLEEAARVDGANLSQILLRVVCPVIIPGMAVVFIFNFTGAWGNFFVPFILLNSKDKLPTAVTLFQYFDSYGRVDFGVLAAHAILYSLPVVILYAVSQKVLSKGFALGGAIK